LNIDKVFVGLGPEAPNIVSTVTIDIITKPVTAIRKSDLRRLFSASSTPRGMVATVSASTTTARSVGDRPSPVHDSSMFGKAAALAEIFAAERKVERK